MSEPRVGYQDELDDLRRDLMMLGALVTDLIGRGTAALLDRDLVAAQTIIDGDDIVDDRSLALEERCNMVMTLQSPIAGDLRFVLTTLRLASELERSADLVVNIAKSARRLYDVTFEPEIRGQIQQMGVEAAFLTRSAIDAYADSNASLAVALEDIDDRLDTLQVDSMAAVFKSHSTGNLDLRAAVQLAMIGRYYERIGDHAVNIGERVSYMVTGSLPHRAHVTDATADSGAVLPGPESASPPDSVSGSGPDSETSC